MMMFFGLAGVALIVLILVDSFETTVLPRRVTHRFRFARLYYLTIWRSLAGGRSLHFQGQLARGVSQFVWPALALGLAGFLGSRPDIRICSAALVARHTGSFAQ